jgi:hypothetical protein
LNMTAVCRTRVGGGERVGVERRRNVCWRWTRGGGVVPSKLVSEMFVRELQAVAPLGARVVFGGLLGLRDHPHKPSNLQFDLNFPCSRETTQVFGCYT